jgi:hypothetical protein
MLPQVVLPKDAASRLGISPSMLRKLTIHGAIGYVRLGSGRQRQRIGYTEEQLAQFLRARTVPPSAVEPPRAATGVRTPPAARGRRAGSSARKAGAADIIDQLIQQSVAAGTTDKWRS